MLETREGSQASLVTYTKVEAHERIVYVRNTYNVIKLPLTVKLTYIHEVFFI